MERPEKKEGAEGWWCLVFPCGFLRNEWRNEEWLRDLLFSHSRSSAWAGCLLVFTLSTAGCPRGALAAWPSCGRDRAMARRGHHGDGCQCFVRATTARRFVLQVSVFCHCFCHHRNMLNSRLEGNRSELCFLSRCVLFFNWFPQDLVESSAGFGSLSL